MGVLTSRPVYTPLLSQPNTFRLLHTSREHPTQAYSLDEASLANKPEYTALSYVCGDGNETLPIECNGNTLSVMTNLHTALTELYATKRHDVLWIDALCINQSGLQEKTHQVQGICDIYSQVSTLEVDHTAVPSDRFEVSSVVAWLGTATASSNLAMDYLMNFESMSSSEVAKHLVALFESPYWTKNLGGSGDHACCFPTSDLPVRV
jgi:hypothetical protein